MKTTWYLSIHIANTEDRIDIGVIQKEHSQYTHIFVTQTDSQHVLHAIEEHLQQQQVHMDQCAGIAFVQGATRFTVARLAGVVINALGWSMNIPIHEYTQSPSFFDCENDMNAKQYVPIPIVYTADPNIGV